VQPNYNRVLVWSMTHRSVGLRTRAASEYTFPEKARLFLLSPLRTKQDASALRTHVPLERRRG